MANPVGFRTGLQSSQRRWIDFASVHVSRTRMHQHREGVVAHPSVSVHHHLAAHIEVANSSAFRDVARGKHDLGGVEGVGHAVVGETNLRRTEEHFHLR